MPSQKELYRLFIYDKKNGLLHRRQKQNNQPSGAEPGWISISGYKQLSLYGRNLMYHRVIWTMMCGDIPIGYEIDHINHDKIDNHIENLRIVSHSDNLKNLSLRSDNKTGISGVCWHSKQNKWQASINVNGRMKYLGVFDCIEKATEARKIAEFEHKYHPNHGAPNCTIEQYNKA